MGLNKALFLDRDGVINVEKNYLYKKEDFEFVDGIFELCRCFADKGYKIIIITNQSGISRGYYSEDDFLKLTSWMEDEFLKQGIKIEKTYFCPHHPDFSGECACRKPNPGMLFQARDELDIDLKNSILIGDKQSDIEAAKNAGLSEFYLTKQNDIKEVMKKLC